MANFRKLLEEALTTAEHSLDRVKNNKDKEFRNEFFKEKGMNVLLNRQEQIKIEIENLREEGNKIDGRLKDLNPRISSSTYNEMNEQGYTGQDRNTNESDYYVFNKLKDSLEYSNYKNFDSIRKRFTQNMNFAISSKEQRAVVAEFYGLDWTSLGIEIPMDIKFDSISIVDGEIKVKPKALSSGV